MNKIFIGLLFVIFVGAGVLFWLMKTLPTVENIPIPMASQNEGGAGETAEKEAHKDDGKNHENAGAEVHSSESEKADGTKSEASHSEHIEEKKSDGQNSAEVEQKLSIRTEPVRAEVFADGKSLGYTPLDVVLKSKKQTLRLQADGFNPVVKEAPAASQKGHDVDSLNWKITLRAQKGALEKSPRAHGEAAVPHNLDEKANLKNNSLFVHGKRGPFWIQVKSFSVAESGEVKNFIQSSRAKLNLSVVGCDVNLGNKGTWTRILVGPFAQKAMAQSTLRRVQAEIGEQPFVTGFQNCQ